MAYAFAFNDTDHALEGWFGGFATKPSEASAWACGAGSAPGVYTVLGAHFAWSAEDFRQRYFVDRDALLDEIRVVCGDEVADDITQINPNA